MKASSGCNKNPTSANRLQSRPSASVSLTLHGTCRIILLLVILSTMPTMSQVSLLALFQGRLRLLQKAEAMRDNFPVGINNGVLLIRNGGWAREFFADVAQHATTEGLAEMRSTIEAELGLLQGGFFDTPIIVYLLKTQPKYLDRCNTTLARSIT